MSRPGWRRWTRIFRRDPSGEVAEELEFHLEQRVGDYMATGMDPDEARRAALDRLGDLARVRSECEGLLAAERRADDRRTLLNVSWLDVKLGVRMLAKYPGLSLVAVIGMAVAITIGAASFAFIDAMLNPTIPLAEGDRVVSIQNWDKQTSKPDRQSLHDLVVWREDLESMRDVGAFRWDRRNLVTADGNTELVRVAEMSASGFRLARVSPVMGRSFVDDDERPGTTPVLVITYGEWQRRFAGDPDIVGRPVRLGGAVHTVIGVMPEGFRFPLNNRYWIPLRLEPTDYEMGGGPSINIFARLADGVTMGQARAELAAVGQRMAAAYPETHGHLRPQVLEYAHPFFDIDSPAVALGLHAVQMLVSLLLVLVSVNVAILVYARTATRTGEIAVRTALGASRGRVLAQLFVEGLVISMAAAALGLTITAFVLNQVQMLAETMAGASLPFWWDLRLSPGLVAYVAGLAVLGGAIVGVLPALKATGRRVQAGLQELSSRGSQMQLGRTWATLIVVQVAIAVAVLPASVFYSGAMIGYGTVEPGYPVEEFIAGRLSMERDESPPSADAAEYDRRFEARFAERTGELLHRLRAEPGTGATFASAYPGNGELVFRIELEDLTGDRGVLVNHVDVGLFDVFDVPVLAGRGFVDADTREGSTAVIVDQTFVERIAGGANVIGRRIRYANGSEAAASDPGQDRWYEIVGVVPAWTPPKLLAAFNEVEPRLYHPAAPVEAQSSMLIVRVSRGSAAGFTRSLRNITAAVDPALQIHEMKTVSESQWLEQRGFRMMALGIMLVTGSVILLSAAGIYAMMSFTVARRRREIGIRSALGADPRRILAGVFARAAAQLGAGAAIGLLLALAADLGTGGLVMNGRSTMVLPAATALMMAVGLIAALGPARRGLAVQPTEALRSE